MLSARTRVAAAIVVGWIALEFAVRYGTVILVIVLTDEPYLGAALALALGIPVVALPLVLYARDRGLPPGEWGYEVTPQAGLAGFLGAPIWLFVLLPIGVYVDTTLLGFDLPEAGYGTASTVAVVIFVIGNGLVVPLAEELVWRGIVQTALVGRFGAVVGIGATAVVFSAKHAIVDVSMARFVTIVLTGLLLGAIKYRWGTASSTVTHATGNLAASLLSVLG